MMRDHSSVHTAPATLRLEESQPGVDPDNPDATPDTALGYQRIAGLGRPVSDPVWDDAERVFADCCRLMGRLREQTARGLSLIATLYLRERHRWADFLAEGVFGRCARATAARQSGWASYPVCRAAPPCCIDRPLGRHRVG